MNSDKSRTVVALVLCLGFFVAWQFWWQAPRDRARAEEREAARLAEEAAASRKALAEGGAESRTAAPVEAAGDAPTSRVDLKPDVAAHQAVEFVLENKFLRLTFSNIGGSLSKAEVLMHKRSALSDEPMNLIRQYEGAARSFELRNLDDPKAWTQDQPWRVEATSVSGDAAGELTFTLEKGVGTFDRPYRVVKRVTLRSDAPVVDVEMSFESFGSETAKPGALLPPQKWRFTPIASLTVDGADYGAEDIQGIRSVAFNRTDDGEEHFTPHAAAELTKAEEKNSEGLRMKRSALSGTRRYVADLNTYFGAYCALVDVTAPVEISVVGVEDPHATGSKVGQVLRTRTDLQLEIRPRKGDEPAKHRLAIYFGPSDQDVLRASMPADLAAWSDDFTRVYRDALGMFKFIGRIVLWLLHVLHGITGSWGVAVVLLTCCVRLVLFPINKRSQNAMRKHGEAMARLKPELDKLKEKYKDKPQEFGAKQMALMKREKVPMLPLGGCLPIFLQIPVFYGLFSGLRASIDLRQASFLWVSDLSQPDHLVRFASPITNPMKWFEACTCCFPPGMSDTITGLHLLPLLMTVAWVLNSMMMPKPANESSEQKQQRKMMLVMPFLFGLMMYGYAAGLSLYWLTSSTVGIFESRLIKAMNAKEAAKAA